MRTTIDIEDALLQEALTITGVRTKKEVVHLALEELVRSCKKKNLIDLAGRIQLTERFDHKAMRKLRVARSRGDRAPRPRRRETP